MNARILDIVCIAVLCTILTLGLWPFHAPKNDVTWLEARNGLRFGKFGTVLSSGEFEMASSHGGELRGSLEIWLQPKRVWDSGTFLAFCTPETPFRFWLRQSQTDLQLHAALQDDRSRTKAVDLYVQGAFREATLHNPAPVFITVTTGAEGTAVYTGGVLAKRAQFRLSPNQFTGRIVLGNSAGQPDNWSGRLLGFAIYDRELTAAQVLRHRDAWTQTGRLQIQGEEGNVALYLFDEHSGNVIHSRGDSGVDLRIPEKDVVLDHILLEPFWTEFNMSESYWSAFIKNIAGFIPFGFCFCARLSMARRVKHAALTTVVLGTLVSLTIEILQSRLPTRDSGMSDIATNTLGTYLGVALLRSRMARVLFARVLCLDAAWIAGASRD